MKGTSQWLFQTTIFQKWESLQSSDNPETFDPKISQFGEHVLWLYGVSFAFRPRILLKLPRKPRMWENYSRCVEHTRTPKLAERFSTLLLF
jgi:hypothetical protein